MANTQVQFKHIKKSFITFSPHFPSSFFLLTTSLPYPKAHNENVEVKLVILH